MKYLIDRFKYRKETISNPIYDNPYSYGKIKIDSNLCDSCGKCINNCLADAFALKDSVVAIDDKKCIYCRNCIDLCETKALTMTSDYKTSVLDVSKSDINIMGEVLRERIYGRYKHSLVLRSVDTGSCNACMLELAAIQNTYYDVSRYGINFAASPRHADGIIVTGAVAINMKEALLKTYYAMAEPRLVIAVGSCAHNGGIFKDCYGVVPVSEILPVNVYIPGCPPSPQALIYGLLKVMDKI